MKKAGEFLLFCYKLLSFCLNQILAKSTKGFTLIALIKPLFKLTCLNSLELCVSKAKPKSLKSSYISISIF